MASVYQDKQRGGWRAEYRPMNAVPGSRARRLRVPKQVWEAVDDPRAACLEWASRGEGLCRTLERGGTKADVREALEAGFITKEQADMLALSIRVPITKVSKEHRLSLFDAARNHPASLRERQRSRLDMVRYHEQCLNRYIEWSGQKYVSDLTLDKVVAWIDHMKQEGLSYDTRRHALIWLRRASNYGKTNGHPDILSGLKLDEQPQDVEVHAPEMKDVVLAYQAIERRGKVAIALMAFMGLRPSEACRLIGSDVRDDVLSVGVRERKNRSSRRDLPIPHAILPLIAEAASAGEDEPLFKAQPRRGGTGFFNHNSLAHWMKPRLAPHLGKASSPKLLRKSFASWAVRGGINPHCVEHFMGHSTSQVTAVTARHYLTIAQAMHYRADAQRISDMLESLLTPIEKSA